MTSASHRNILVRVLGTGFNAHRYEIGYRLSRSMGLLPGVFDAGRRLRGRSRPIFRTTTLAGYIIDTGILGIDKHGVARRSGLAAPGCENFLRVNICTSPSHGRTAISRLNTRWFCLYSLLRACTSNQGALCLRPILKFGSSVQNAKVHPFAAPLLLCAAGTQKGICGCDEVLQIKVGDMPMMPAPIVA